MKLNSDLPAFYGYYGSIFDGCDTTIEFDYINETRIENGLLELENDNDIIWDYTTYYSELNLKITDCVYSFLWELDLVKSIEFVKLISPKFYNFTNDRIECIIDVNVKEVKKYINDNLHSFELYLIGNFKSRDGFNSFYEYRLDHWLNKMKSFKNLDHIEVHALLDFICQIEDFDFVSSLYAGMYDIPFLQALNFEQITIS